MKVILPALTALSLSIALVSSADAKIAGRFQAQNQGANRTIAYPDAGTEAGKIIPLKSSVATMTINGSMVFVNMDEPSKNETVLEIFSSTGVIVESYKLQAGKSKFAVKCDIPEGDSYYAVLREGKKSAAILAPISHRSIAGKN